MAITTTPLPAWREDDAIDALFVHGDPNGLAFDRATGRLYAAEAKTGCVIAFEGTREVRIARIPSGGIVAANRLGGITATPYGTLFVTRLGYGSAGAIFAVEPDGQIWALDDLPARYWRLGVAYDAYRHSLYTTQYSKLLRGSCEGSIVEIELASGRARTVLDGFGKPIGVVKLDSTLVVTDPMQRAVYKVVLDGERAVSCTPLATLARFDSICACDSVSVLVTSYDETKRVGTVQRLWLDGRKSTLAAGSWQPRGVACDGERAFVAARRTGRILVFRV